MNSEAAIVVVALVIVLGLAGLGAAIAFLLTLQRAVGRCAPRNRLLSPDQVWLNLIPIFGIVWQFMMVGRIADTLRNEFAARGTPRAPVPDDYGRGVGLAMCILGVVSIIPYVGILTGLAGMVCWIVYWVKISGYSRELAQGGAPAGALGAFPMPASYATAAAPEPVSAGERGWVALVLIFGYGASYFQRAGLSAVVFGIRDALHISTVQLGLVFSIFAFGLMAGYILMTVVTVLCGARRSLAAAFIGVSLASCASGLVPGYGGLLAARFLLGVFMGGLLPGAVQAARDWFPPSLRPLLIGAVLTAGPAVSLGAVPLLTFAAQHLGWQAVFMITGLPTLIAAGMCLAWWPTPAAPEPFRGISTPAFASSGMVALGLLFGAPVSYVTSMAPAYLQRLGGNISTIAVTGSAIPLANCFGALLAGVMAWALMSGRTPPSRVRAALLTVFGCLLPVIALGGIGSQWVVTMASALAMIGYAGWSALLYSAVADAFPARGVAVGAALGALMASIGGMAGPAVFAGMIAEVSGYGAVFAAAGATAVVGVAGVLLLAWLVGREPSMSAASAVGF